MIGGLIGLAATLSLAATQHSSCDKATQSASSVQKGPVQAEDLLSLWDIGGPADFEAPFTLSPDGSKVAVAVRRAVPQTNGYCTRIYVIDIASGIAQPIARIDGSAILSRFDLGPLTNFGGGVLETVLPRWSPDGARIAYLELRDGVAQVMSVPSSGGLATQVTHSEVDVRNFQWQGSEIVFASRPDSAATAEAVEAEGRTGYRFDDRWDPLVQDRPFPKASALRYFVEEKGETPREVSSSGFAEDSGQRATGAADTVAWIAPKKPEFINSPKEIRFRAGGASERICDAMICENASKVWLRPDGRSVYFQRRTGWGDSLTQIVRLSGPSWTAKVVLETEDNVVGCRAAPTALICVIDGALQPRRLEAVSYRTGTRRVLFDPNPAWVDKKMGRADLLKWRNARGAEVFGRLVLPPDHVKGKRLPLVVVGYQARGFLRGGTGDLFPILPLAAEGHAVLVYSFAKPVGSDELAKDQDEINSRAYAGWAEPKSAASAIFEGIDLLVKQGLVDRSRVGLTGFSAGAVTAVFALRLGGKFRAVSFAGCCGEPYVRETMIGPYLRETAQKSGFPALDYDEIAKRDDYALSVLAPQIDAPIMIQTADREFRMGLEADAAFRRAGKPIELYVYPDEYHNLWQPEHRRAAYARNVAWFDRHLLGKESVWADSVLQDRPQPDQRSHQTSASTISNSRR